MRPGIGRTLRNKSLIYAGTLWQIYICIIRKIYDLNQLTRILWIPMRDIELVCGQFLLEMTANSCILTMDIFIQVKVYMKTSVRTLLALTLACSVSSLMGSTPAIGFAATQGSFKVNAQQAQGTATVFDGTVIETG